LKKRQRTKRGFDPDYEVAIINKVKAYIEMEYSEEVYKRITSGKFLNILTGYITNCLSLNKPEKYTIPFMAQHMVNYARKSY